ncbi:hypothetical protein MC885_015218 [Smutsia gigantea]|nr:hypothetical protein MC885_015218 [Smutsia gigantea]
MNKKFSEKQFYQPGSSKTTKCTNNLPSFPPNTWGAGPGGAWSRERRAGGRQGPRARGILHVTLALLGRLMTELTPCFLFQAGVKCVDFETGSPGKHLGCSNSSKQQLTCTFHFF